MTTPAEPSSSTRRPSSSTSSRTGKRENVFTRKLGPLPMWVWVAIIGAAVILYTLWKGKSSASTKSGTGSAGPSHGSFGASLVPPVVIHGARGARGRRGRPGPGGGDDEDDDDRERRKRRRRRGDDDDRRRHHNDETDRDEDEDEQEKRSPRVMTRNMPGAGPMRGTLQSFTTPASGVSPSLAQVAAQYNTAPDAIVEEATGRGSPHGALWRRYVAAHDWQAPLPHGTDMTILQQPA